MNMVFFNFTVGDPIWLQKLTWQLSHPAFWFVLLKWCLIFVGVVLLANRLLKAKRFFWFSLFILSVILGFWGVYELFGQAIQSVRDGLWHEVVWLRIVGLVTDAVAIFVAIRILYASFTKRF
ncbi:hypothetical protein F9L33_00945 [Amylibacter sp. SFDW26]|uniref:hypothetical protein n=1 Tax=Amylibacter sp. SFDW26 TaxID=2652722 RepID=UPI001262872B|nr:hypothetical protein [Amylibacter sp. SFDW26]KAB7615366.1 hypothetical protein F9L33_00945 [Amylibacter sp. SFDW26]